jgi:hypothetical protein
MNRDRIITLTTRLAALSIILLLYWVFALVSILVFDFKVFRENLTESFYLSILGILSVLGGSLIVNVILNLSKIADSVSAATGSPAPPASPIPRSYLAIFLLLFPALFACLYVGDVANSARNRRRLVESAQYLIEQNRSDIESFGAYSFDPAYVARVAEVLQILGNRNESAPGVSLIVSDSVRGRQLFLEFSRYRSWPEKGPASRTDFIHSCSSEENEYLKSVFAGRQTGHRFSAHGGSYELYYPIKTSTRTIVIYFTDRSEYGGFGS